MKECEENKRWVVSCTLDTLDKSTIYLFLKLIRLNSEESLYPLKNCKLLIPQPGWTLGSSLNLFLKSPFSINNNISKISEHII